MGTIVDATGAELLVEVALREQGYVLTSIEPLGGEFVATAIKQVGATPYRAAAIGRTRQDAARQLLVNIERR